MSKRSDHFALFWLSLFVSAFVCFDNSAFGETVSVSLAVDHLVWPNDEYIDGGRIEVRGGAVIAFHQAGPLNAIVKNDPKTATSTLSLFFFQPSGPPPEKDSESSFMQNWFQVDRAKQSPSATCPTTGCPIEIEGELILDTFSPDGKSHPRKVTLTTSDFVLTEIPPPQ